MRTVYICYGGLREPLTQTQVLPYLRELRRAGIGVSLLTFERESPGRWPSGQRERWAAPLERSGIRWSWRRYHARPSLPATLWDIAAGAAAVVRIARRSGAGVLHARSDIPLAMALLARRCTGARLVFDVRGLLAEEYAAAGRWRRGGAIFRTVTRLERLGFHRADQLIVLTHRMKRWLTEGGRAEEHRIRVIPCCVEVERFRRPRRAGPANFEVVYAGSITGLYLLDDVGRFFLEVKRRRPGARLRVLTHGPATAGMRALAGAGLSEPDFEFEAVAPDEVPERLADARLGVSFRRATSAQIAASPTKVAEYLAAGVPVVSSAGVGDHDELLLGERVGVTVPGLGSRDLAIAADRAIALAEEPDVAERCVAAARRHFSLADRGGPGYVEVYRRLQA